MFCTRKVQKISILFCKERILCASVNCRRPTVCYCTTHFSPCLRLKNTKQKRWKQWKYLFFFSSVKPQKVTIKTHNKQFIFLLLQHNRFLGLFTIFYVCNHIFNCSHLIETKAKHVRKKEILREKLMMMPMKRERCTTTRILFDNNIFAAWIWLFIYGGILKKDTQHSYCK